LPISVNSEVILAVYIITFVIGFPANLLALYAFSVKIHVKANPTDILLLNLTVSDLLFLIILPLKMYEADLDMNWNLPQFLCSLTAFIFFSTIYTSSLLLMAVSLVRYIALAFPITYHRLHKPVYAVVMGAVIWLISFAHCSIPAIALNHPSLAKETLDGQAHACFTNFTEKQLDVLLPIRLEVFFFLCLVPLVICVYCYVQCILIVYSRPRISRMQKQKAIGMALGTLVTVFLICWVSWDRGALEPRRPACFFPGSDFKVPRPHRSHQRDELALCFRHVKT
ncbi:free fatty acid receptor 2-like, partial [Limanda limanda]|uniref:free fatty acid receptor 2-like n=1 Tax=Limanda limanda TaxID=27771 RepID=UPI0029C845BA